MLDDGDDFSFSGLKTAVVQWVRKHPDAEVADVAASFQAAVVDVLVTKLVRAAERNRFDTIVIGGGVAANSALRARVLDEAEVAGLRAVLPEPGAVHGQRGDGRRAAWWRYRSDGPTGLDDGAFPNLSLA